jgi:hypothetical protein
MYRFAFMAILGVALASSTSLGGVLTLTIDVGTGEAWIENLSDSNTRFFAYEIKSAGANLDPAAWVSFQDLITADPVAAVQLLGSTGWAELAAMDRNLTEGNLPGETNAAPGFKASLGIPVDEFLPGDITFKYSDPSFPTPQTRVRDGLINLIGISAHPWQNPVNRFDINNSGSVSPFDALVLIDQLNGAGPRALTVPTTPTDQPPPFLDPSGDNNLSAFDALTVIDEINRLIGTGAAVAVPEPTTALLALLALATACITRGFRRGREAR